MSGKGGFMAFVVGGLSFFGMAFITAYPEWLRNSQVSSQSYLRGQYVFHGLWWRCYGAQNGLFQCDFYDTSLLGLQADVQAFRALMCIATISSFFGVLIALLGLDCTTMIEPGSKTKARTSLVAGIMFAVAAELQAQRALMLISILSSLMGLVMGMVSLRCTTMMDNGSKVKSIIGMASGACFLLAGVCCGAAVSWYAWKVTMEYFHPLYQEREFKYEYGACLYIGWVAMALGSCVMVATIWFGVQVQNAFYNPKNKNNSFKYEFGSCLYVGWITGALTLIAGLILTVGSCKNMRKGKEASYSTYSYKPQVQASKSGGDKTEYV